MGPLAEKIIAQYHLTPLDGEGGYVRRTFTSRASLETSSISPHFNEQRLPLVSHIYYLITRESFSSLHRLHSSEVWTWLEGDPAVMITIDSHHKLTETVIGPEGLMHAVTFVEGGKWQGTRLIDNETKGYALFSITVVPSFDIADFTLADEALLSSLDESLRPLVRPFLAKEDI